MYKPFAIQQFLREFFEALAQGAKSLFDYSGPLEVLEDSTNCFVAVAGRGVLSVDKASNTIKLRGRLIAPVKAVTSIEIKRSQDGDGNEVWKINLCLLRNQRVEVGRLFDDIDASILGAKLSTITEKTVAAVR